MHNRFPSFQTHELIKKLQVTNLGRLCTFLAEFFDFLSRRKILQILRFKY